MSFLRKFLNFFRRRQLESEMNEEICAHLEMQADQHRAAGLGDEDAHYAAQRQFGNVASLQEQVRDGRWWTRIELFLKEVGIAARGLRRAPGFTAAVLTTLVLCIGPNTAILSALYTFVYKPLPFPEPERIVAINNVADRLGGAKRACSIPQYDDFVQHADTFEGFSYFASLSATIGGGAEPSRGFGMDVSANFFGSLGMPLALGRGFVPEEQQPGKARVVILSQLAWRRYFQADPGVLGRELRLDDEPYTIVGVAASNLEQLFNDVEFFRPRLLAASDRDPGRRYAATVRLIGRLKPGVSLAAAQAQLTALEKRFREGVASAAVRTAIAADGFRVVVADGRRELAEPVRGPLWLLQGGAALVLLLGCVNVASLLLARASTKRQEFAIRQALGAGRATLLRQMLAEGFLLGSFAGVLGVGLGLALLRLMNAYLSLMIRHVPPIALEPRVLGIVLITVTGLMILMAIVPFCLWWKTEHKPTETSQASTGKLGRRTIGALVVGQVALALILLVGAGLLLHSFARVMAVRPGFDAERVMHGRLYLSNVRYQNPTDLLGAQDRILGALAAIPGVEAVGLSADFPVKEKFNAIPFLVHDSGLGPGADSAMLYVSPVSPGFFAALGIPVREGRLFREDDDMRRAPVAVVDETFVQRFFPGRNVVGMELVFGRNPPPEGRPWITIVGVVARAQIAGLEGRDGWPFVYLPFMQQPATAFSFVVRSPRGEADIGKDIRERIQAIDPGIPVAALDTLSGSLDAMLGNRQALLAMIGSFAILALILAGVGLYGVLAYDVSQRTKEIGIRGAIGASRGQIVALVLRQGLARSAAGLVVGLAGALYLSRFLERLLFDVRPTDPVAFGVVVVLLLGVALLASWLPARRAAKVDPVVALRAE